MLTERLGDSVAECYIDLNYYKGIDLIMEALRKTNAYVETEKPWELKKTDTERLQVVLCLVLETLRVTGIMLQPVVPGLAGKLLDKLNVKDRSWSQTSNFSWKEKSQDRPLSSDKVVLFKKVS